VGVWFINLACQGGNSQLTVVLKLFWKFSEQTLFKTCAIIFWLLDEQVQNLEESKASFAEVASCYATVKAMIK